MWTAAVGYIWTQARIIAADGQNSAVARAVGSDTKGRISLLLYAVGLALAFVSPWVAIAIYVGIAVMWLVPDRRIERELEEDQPARAPARTDR